MDKIQFSKNKKNLVKKKTIFSCSQSFCYFYIRHYVGYFWAITFTFSKLYTDTKILYDLFCFVFADLRLLQDNGTRNIKEARKLSQEQNQVQHFVQQNLAERRLPKLIEIIKTGEDHNDD